MNSLDSRPIKIQPGTYCKGDSAHALQITQNMGNRTAIDNVKPYTPFTKIIHKTDRLTRVLLLS